MDIFLLRKKIEPLGFRIGFEEPSSNITMTEYENGAEYILKKNIDNDIFYDKIMSTEKLTKEFLLSYFEDFKDPYEEGVDY